LTDTVSGGADRSLGPSGDRMDRGALSWSIFEGGRDPYVILVTIYIFMPYVAATMVGDPVQGQEIISRWSQYAGWAVMATAPFLGASIDQLGRRKGWLALSVGLMIPLIASLWFAKPDGSGLSVAMTMFLASAVIVLFGLTDVLHNSLLIRAAGVRNAHKASGLALSLGNFFSVLALGFTAWAFALPGNVDWSWVPKEPLFGLDTRQNEHDRVVVLMAALLLLLGSIPILLFTPDAERTGIPVHTAFARGARELWRMLRTVGHHRDAAIYMVSRMFFVDGMNGVLTYAGVYAVGVMKWGTLEMLFYGILLSCFAVLGGFVARWLDASLGPKRALQIEIFMSMIGLIAFLGMAPDQILFFWSYDPTAHGPWWNGPVFQTLPDLVFVAVGFSNAIFITAQYASSRTLLTRLTPPEQTGAFFGVYAVSGVATAWLAPGMVNLGTRLTNTQQWGFAMLLILLLVGLAGLFFVKGGGAKIE
jgi:MFS transporter, UMF1 family